MSNKINILVLTSSFPRYKSDWWAQFVLCIYKYLDDKKVFVTVLAPDSPNSKKKETIGGVKVKRFSYFFPRKLQVLTTGEGILYSSKKNFLAKLQIFTFLISQMSAVVRTMLKDDFDIIHAHWIIPQGLVAVFINFFFNKPLIVTVHGSDVYTLKKFNFLKKFVLDRCSVCTVNSSATYNAIKKISPETNVVIIPMGVDFTKFNKNKFDKKWKKKFGVDSTIILTVGRLIKIKGFDYLIRSIPAVLNKFPKAKFMIVGSGPEKNNLERLARKLKIKLNKNLFFLGNLKQDYLAHIFASSDIFVFPPVTSKTGQKEGQGVVVLEAIASGVPVIASRSGGITDMIENKVTGILFKEKDHQTLSKEIISILSNKNKKNIITKNALNYIRKKYSWNKISRDFKSLFDKLSV